MPVPSQAALLRDSTGVNRPVKHDKQGTDCFVFVKHVTVFKPQPTHKVGSGGCIFCTPLSVLPSVSPCIRDYVSAISPVSVDGFSLKFGYWCILGQNKVIRFWGQKIKVTLSRRRHPALNTVVEFRFLVDSLL